MTAILVGTYLVAAYATNFGTLLSTGGGVYNGAVKTLQGRG